MKVIDAAGREWHPRITCLTFVMVEKKLGMSFEQILGAMKAGHVLPVFELFYAACRAKVLEQNISFEDFCDSFTSKNHLDVIAAAIGEAAESFFPNGGKPEAESKPVEAARGASATSTK